MKEERASCSFYLVGNERLVFCSLSDRPPGGSQSNGRTARLDLPASDEQIGLFVLEGLSFSGLPGLPPPDNTRYLQMAGKKTWAALVRSSSCIHVSQFAEGFIRVSPSRRDGSRAFVRQSNDDLEPVVLAAGATPAELGETLMDTFAMIRERFVG